HVLTGTQIRQVAGNGVLGRVEIEDNAGKTWVDASAVLVFIGSEPQTDWIKPLCDCDERGFLITDTNYRTKTPGVFCAGDIRSGSTKRIAAGVGEGSATVAHVHSYLDSLPRR